MGVIHALSRKARRADVAVRRVHDKRNFAGNFSGWRVEQFMDSGPGRMHNDITGERKVIHDNSGLSVQRSKQGMTGVAVLLATGRPAVASAFMQLGHSATPPFTVAPIRVRGRCRGRRTGRTLCRLVDWP